MNQWIREAWPRPRAKMTGALYLLYFLTAILAQFLVGRGLAVSGNVTNVIATVCYLGMPGHFVPVEMRQTGMRGAMYGARKEAYGGADRESAATG